MTIKKIKNNIGFLSLIFILLLGTCLGNFQTGLSSVRNFSASAVSSDESTAITPAGTTFPIQTFLTGKISASLETVIHIKRSAQRVISHSGRVNSAFLSIHKEFGAEQNSSSFLTVNDHIQILLGHMVIINYIHHQDGQKSYIPFSTHFTR